MGAQTSTIGTSPGGAAATPYAVDRIARYAADLEFDDLPAAAVARAREVVLDTLGTTLGGYQSRLGRLAVAYAATRYPGDEAVIIGDGRRATLEGAAWANGVMAKVLGMDDTHRVVLSHVAAELVPTALAVGEFRRIDGRRLITALVAGYDMFGALQLPGAKER